MAELWDVLDADGEPTGALHERGIPLAPGEYHLVVHVWLRGRGGDFLITKRSPGKPYEGYWETTGGAVQAGEDSLTGALREVREELGITLNPAHGRRLWRYRRGDDFADVWLFECDTDPADTVLQEGETCGVRRAGRGEILELMARGDERERGESVPEAFVPLHWYPYINDLFRLDIAREYGLVRRSAVNGNMPDWAGVPRAPVDIWLWRLDCKPETTAQLALCNGGLAVRMTCRERDPVARHTAYGEEVWVDSAMECFFGMKKGGVYINCEMNSAGNCLIGVGDGREGRVSIDDYGPCPAVCARVGADSWYAETFFTHELLCRVFGSFEPETGNALYANFFKVGEETPCPHYGMWSPIAAPEPDFHRPECFGVMRVAGE